MENIIVLLIVGVAAIYCLRSFIKQLRGESSCDGCSACNLAGQDSYQENKRDDFSKRLL